MKDGADDQGVVAVEEAKVRLQKVEVNSLEKGDDWWAYLRRCNTSGSMRNRRRIWKAVKSIEAAAERAGV
jgi:hypothetical protein